VEKIPGAAQGRARGPGRGTNLIASLAPKLPVYERETSFVALKSDEEYALYDGWIASTDMPGVKIPVSEYKSVTNEYMLPQSTAKWCKHKRESYFAGAWRAST